VPGNQPGQGREPQPVARLVADPADLAAKHRVLVPEHQELGVLGHLVPGQHYQTAKQATREQVENRKDHSWMISARNTGQDLARRDRVIEPHRVASARRECTDRILIAGRQHLHHTFSEYVDHYNTHRPHRTLSQRPPAGRTHIAPADDNIRVRRRDRLGGLLHEYSQVA
jgi:Integrase core domain